MQARKAITVPKPIHLPKMVSIIAWNCRGAKCAQTRSNLKMIIDKHNPGVLILTETKVVGPQANEICHSLGFSEWKYADPVGFSGGVWLLCNAVDIHLHVVKMDSHAIHVVAEVFLPVYDEVKKYFSLCVANFREDKLEYLISIESIGMCSIVEKAAYFLARSVICYFTKRLGQTTRLKNWEMTWFSKAKEL